VCCTWHGVWCNVALQLATCAAVPRTVHVCLEFRGVRTCCILVLHVVCCRLLGTCLRGQWDPCCMLHAMLCVLHLAGCMLHVAWCTLYVVCRTLRVVCCMLYVSFCRFLLLHVLSCTVSAAHSIVRVGCCSCHRAPVCRARVQGSGGGGVLYMSGGRATFESVAISDTEAISVRAPGEADRVGGGLGRRCAGRWHGVHIRWVSLVQGRQHRTLFGTILFADSCACRMELHGVHCTLHSVWCMLQLVLRTAQVTYV
jgi:hypothetical protein